MLVVAVVHAIQMAEVHLVLVDLAVAELVVVLETHLVLEQ
jgi:hypothetical protein